MLFAGFLVGLGVVLEPMKPERIETPLQAVSCFRHISSYLVFGVLLLVILFPTLLFSDFCLIMYYAFLFNIFLFLLELSGNSYKLSAAVENEVRSKYASGPNNGFRQRARLNPEAFTCPGPCL